MCCLTAIFVVFGSRITILFWWLMEPLRFELAFKNWPLAGTYALPAWAWTLLGGIFLPWTTLAYLIVFPGGIVGTDWIVLGVALLIDLAGHGSGYRYRKHIPSYRRQA
jgi:hypothetical protein